MDGVGKGRFGDQEYRMGGNSDEMDINGIVLEAMRTIRKRREEIKPFSKVGLAVGGLETESAVMVMGWIVMVEEGLGLVIDNVARKMTEALRSKTEQCLLLNITSEYRSNATCFLNRFLDAKIFRYQIIAFAMITRLSSNDCPNF